MNSHMDRNRSDGRPLRRLLALEERKRPSGHVDQAQFRVGMDVVDTRGSIIGRVKEIRTTDVLVDRRLQRDVYMPITAVYIVQEDALVLNLRAVHVESMHWPRPPLWRRGQPPNHREQMTEHRFRQRTEKAIRSIIVIETDRRGASTHLARGVNRTPEVAGSP